MGRGVPGTGPKIRKPEFLAIRGTAGFLGDATE